MIVITEPKVGTDEGKILEIRGDGYENAAYFHTVRSKMVTDTLRELPEP